MKLSIVCLVVAILALVVVGCTAAKPAAVPEVVKTPSAPAVVELPQDSAPVNEDASVARATGEVLSSLSCTGKTVKLTLTNLLEKEVAVKDVEFRVNAAVDRTPDCEADVLAPGQATLCSGLDAVPLGRQPIVQARLPSGTLVTQKVMCG